MCVSAANLTEKCSCEEVEKSYMNKEEKLKINRNTYRLHEKQVVQKFKSRREELLINREPVCIDIQTRTKLHQNA